MRIASWWTARSPMLRAALLMLLGAGCVALQVSAVRFAIGTLHAFEIALFRNLIGFLVILPFLGRLGPSALRTRQPFRLITSSLGLYGAMICWFLAVAEIPLAEAMALSFTKPLFATLGAALILGELVRSRRWTAVVVGFAGVLVVLRPGADAISPYALLMLLSALLLAGVALQVKHMTKTESATTIVLYQSIFITLISLPLALLYWRTPTMTDMLLLLVIGTIGTVKELTTTRALALVDASVVVAFEFLRLPLTALAAYIFFAEIPTIWIWTGGAVIFGATAYIAHREMHETSRTTAPEA
ncbi:MAG: DMT family transporter [Pseudomonadota bacterium]